MKTRFFWCLFADLKLTCQLYSMYRYYRYICFNFFFTIIVLIPAVGPVFPSWEYFSYVNSILNNFWSTSSVSLNFSTFDRKCLLIRRTTVYGIVQNENKLFKSTVGTVFRSYRYFRKHISAVTSSQGRSRLKVGQLRTATTHPPCYARTESCLLIDPSLGCFYLCCWCPNGGGPQWGTGGGGVAAAADPAGPSWLCCPLSAAGCRRRPAPLLAPPDRRRR